MKTFQINVSAISLAQCCSWLFGGIGKSQTIAHDAATTREIHGAGNLKMSRNYARPRSSHYLVLLNWRFVVAINRILSCSAGVLLK